MTMNKNNRRRLTIAVDGFSSCGKSTFAKALAARFGYVFVDTGAMYRAVTLFALENGAIRSGIVDEEALVALLPKIDIGDILYIHDTGAHGSAMGYNYNGKLHCAEVLEQEGLI